MVRNYKRTPGSRQYRNYSEDTLNEAIARYRRGNLKDLSNEYGFPHATLYRKIKRLHTKAPGGQPVLSEEEELNLVKALSTAADWGFPCDSEDVKDIVKSYLQRSGKTITQFKNNRPGQTWLENF